MQIIVTGATGLVGAEVVRQAMMDPEIKGIAALVRRTLDIPALPEQGREKLKTVVHSDFLNYGGLESLFKNHDAVLWCLGISQNQVSKEDYFTITHDYALAVAGMILKTNPSMRLIFVSGEGADSSEKSRTLFARVKGKTENDLIKSGIKNLFLARPGGIKPVHRNPQAPWSNKIVIPFFPIFEWLMPKMVISSAELARVLLFVAKNGYGKVLVANPELKDIFKSL
jgi:uncharacterized protein YbjT (DUF2867 family)